jgi:hypothetical protein
MVDTLGAAPATNLEAEGLSNLDKPRSWIIPALAGLVLGMGLGGLAVHSLEGPVASPYTQPDPITAGFGSAPAPAWTDVAVACDHLTPLVAAYGKDGQDGFPFSEVAWLTSLVDTTELMGATGVDHASSTFSQTPEGHIAYLASDLRMVTIGGGFSHPQFPVHLADLMDACDTYRPTP